MKRAVAATALITIIVCVLAFFAFPNLPDLSSKVILAISFAILVPQLIAVGAFLTSMHAFKKGLRIAYYALTVSILLLSFNQLQLAVTSFVTIDPIKLAWFITISTLLGAILMYLGMRKFLTLLRQQSRPWGSIVFVSILAIVVSVASAFIPHDAYPISELTLDGIFGTYVLGGSFAFAATFLAWRIRKSLAANYQAAMGWLVIAAAALAFSCVHETLIRLLPVFNHEAFAWYFIYGISLWPLFLVGVAFWVSSLFFKKISQERAELPEDANYLDVLNYVANLVSNPQAIDVALDEVRKITVTGATVDTLSSAQKAVLIRVYKKIEKYLVTEEPLRRVTKEDLQTRLPDDFRSDLSD